MRSLAEMRPHVAVVPLGWRNMMADKRRLLRSTSGIAFAIVLMLIELGFRNAFVAAAVDPIRAFAGDIVITSAAKYQFARNAPFPQRRLYEARAVSGVAWARPVYAAWIRSVWENPATHRRYALQLFAFDPDQPVFNIAGLAASLVALHEQDTVLTDRCARPFVGRTAAGAASQLAGTAVHVVGTFCLDPDFYSDGTLIMSDRTFFKIFGTFGPSESRPDPEFAIVEVAPGSAVSTVRRALRAALPDDVKVLTKAQFIAQESEFQASLSGVGPVFGVGALIGFAVGMIISYQVLYSDIADQLPQYATLKAIGYTNRALVMEVVKQAVFYGLAGYLAAWAIALALYRAIAVIVLLPLRMTFGLTLLSLALTVAMCVLSALVAVRRVVQADPAEVF